MKELLFPLPVLALAGCIVIDAGEVRTEVERDASAVLSAKDASALAWEENVSGKPIVLRRTTLIVRDMEKTLALYRDALGMKVQCDQVLTSPAGQITTLVSMLVDPDGHTVELNQVLHDPRRQ